MKKINSFLLTIIVSIAMSCQDDGVLPDTFKITQNGEGTYNVKKGIKGIVANYRIHVPEHGTDFVATSFPYKSGIGVYIPDSIFYYAQGILKWSSKLDPTDTVIYTNLPMHGSDNVITVSGLLSAHGWLKLGGNLKYSRNGIIEQEAEVPFPTIFVK